MKKSFLLSQSGGVVVYPDYPPDDVLALVDLLWIALGCPPSLPS